MNQKQLRDWQPTVFAQFQMIVRQERLAHAYLFSGGFASYEMALFLSQSVFCQHKQDGLPCGECRSCRLIAQNEFSDVVVIEPQGNTIKTDTIRELVSRFAQTGFESRSQVFIIKDAEKMHINAANSLLKVMEEPQGESHLFLLTSQEEAILPTIKSRTQVFVFPKPLPLLTRKIEELGVVPTTARLLAQLAGDMAEAERLAQDKRWQEVLTVSRRFVASLLRHRETAYLQVSSLTRLVVEKADQERLLNLLALLLAQEFAQSQALVYLEQLTLARQMWKSNVSLQSVLEYMVLHPLP